MGVAVSIELEEPIRTGERFSVAVVVSASRATQIRRVTLALRGCTNLRLPADDDEAYSTFHAASRRLSEATTLERGTRRFEASFRLPADAPPSAVGAVEIFYRLRAVVEVPWWFDAIASRVVEVERAPRDGRPPRRPITVGSDARDRDALFVELSLDDTTFAPGEAITGSFSVGNIGGHRLDGATLMGGGAPPTFKSLIEVEEGSVIPFALPIPAKTALAFESATLAIEHHVHVSIDGSPVTCSIPIVIDTFEARANGPRSTPLTGGVRWRSLWRDEGARVGLSLEGRDLCLSGTLASAVGARVKPRGNGLAATLSWQSLGIGLTIAPRAFVARGVSLDELPPAFRRRFAAWARELEQLRAALGRDLCDALLAFDEAEIDDVGATVASPAAARDPEALRGFLAAVAELSRAIVAAERRLPPPSWAESAEIAAWRTFAAASTGTLHAGRMAITEALWDGDHVDVETLLDPQGRPDGTRVTLVLDPELDAPPSMPASARADVLRSVRGAAPRLEIRNDAMVLEIGGKTTDPATLRAPVAEMQRLARRLRSDAGRGPYR